MNKPNNERLADSPLNRDCNIKFDNDNLKPDSNDPKTDGNAPKTNDSAPKTGGDTQNSSDERAVTCEYDHENTTQNAPQNDEKNTLDKQQNQQDKQQHKELHARLEKTWRKHLTLYLDLIEQGKFTLDLVHSLLDDLIDFEVNKITLSNSTPANPTKPADGIYTKLLKSFPKIKPLFAKYFGCDESEILVGDYRSDGKRICPYCVILGNYIFENVPNLDHFVGQERDFSAINVDYFDYTSDSEKEWQSFVSDSPSSAKYNHYNQAPEPKVKFISEDLFLYSRNVPSFPNLCKIGGNLILLNYGEIGVMDAGIIGFRKLQSIGQKYYHKAESLFDEKCYLFPELTKCGSVQSFFDDYQRGIGSEFYAPKLRYVVGDFYAINIDVEIPSIKEILGMLVVEHGPF